MAVGVIKFVNDKQVMGCLLLRVELFKLFFPAISKMAVAVHASWPEIAFFSSPNMENPNDLVGEHFDIFLWLVKNSQKYIRWAEKRVRLIFCQLYELGWNWAVNSYWICNCLAAGIQFHLDKLQAKNERCSSRSSEIAFTRNLFMANSRGQQLAPSVAFDMAPQNQRYLYDFRVT